MAGFTPGPWEAATFPEANGAGWLVVDNRRRNLGRIYYASNSSAKTEANARLIAAAPELYEALLMVSRDSGKLSHMGWQQVERALAKARGEQ